MSLTDTREAVRLLRVAVDQANQLDARDIPRRQHGKDRQVELAELQRNLLQLAHLCDKARVIVLDQYHAVRGFNDHLVSGGTS